jgi:carboxymethylenebutenolidase
MTVVTDWEIVDTSYGPMRMYTARPEGGTAGPGVLIVSDRFGLTNHIQDVSRRFAEEGIVALAPDLYHRLGTRAVAHDDPDSADALRAQLTDTEIIDDLTLALRFLGARGEVRSGLTGVVGYGEGGRDAFLLATRNADVLAVVAYGGAIAADDPSAPISASPDLQAPALLFVGEEDETTPAADCEYLQKTLDSLGKDYELVSYPGARAGFFCEARNGAYDEKATEDAWTRSVDFLYQRLEG